MIYTGIGSRETPLSVIEKFIKPIANKLSERGYTLRSGGADGADKAFEDNHYGKKEIYLPWYNFNRNESLNYKICDKAYDLASKIHPVWGNLSHGGKKLHARNCYQVLGINLDKPSDMIICWTPGGEDVGGTRTAIKLAKLNNIPVINIYNYSSLEEIMKDIDNAKRNNCNSIT